MKRCLMCEQGVEETQSHVLLECGKYREQRQRVVEKVDEALRVADKPINATNCALAARERYCLMLGMRTGSACADARIDSATKRFLREIWVERSPLTRSINKAFDRHDVLH